MPSGKEPEYSPALDPEHDSFSNRILASASALASSTFSQPPTNSEFPASGSISEDKAGPSSTSVSSNERTGHHSTVDSNAKSQHPSRSAPFESFRSDIHSSENQRNGQITQNAFDDFKASSRELNAFVDTLPDLQSQRTQAAEKGNKHHPEARIGNDGLSPKLSFSIPYPSPPQDGAAVIDLLSDPSFMLDDHVDNDADVMQLGDQRIFDARSNTSKSMKNLAEQVDLRDWELSVEFSKTWRKVFAGYQDEVWGDRSPAAEDARTELRREIQAGVNKPGNGPAVNRLRMLLGHMLPSSTG